jgi:hypothetical protein
MESIVIYLSDFIYVELDRAIKQSTIRKLYIEYDLATTEIHDKIWQQSVQYIKQQLYDDN